MLTDKDSERQRTRLADVEEGDEAVLYDLSALDGSPIRMKAMPKKTSSADAMEAEQRLLQAGYAAEYERLEQQLGAGMSSVMEQPFVHKAKPDASHPPTRRETISRRQAQVAAEDSGEILAISETPVDISGFTGVDIDARRVLSTYASQDQSKMSYYFPEDPDMPAWRPMSMGWPYIAMLSVLALAFAGLQEFLCQLSLKRARAGQGLIKFTVPADLTVTEYFTWKYAPVLTFVIYGILWQVSDFEVKRLEPYYQLSRKNGATAGESLNMDYVTFVSWLVPLRALRHRQYAVIYSSLATLIAGSLVPVLQSASVVVWPPKNERSMLDPKYIRIDPIWSRTVTVSLILVAICGGVLLYQLRRKSGLLSDPKGIAGIAAMATRSHILTDFHGLDAAPLHKLHKQLRQRRYILHKSSLWQGEYIRKSAEHVRESGSDPRPLMLRLRAGVPYMAFIVVVTILLPMLLFIEGAQVVTDKLPFLLTALATSIKLLWGAMSSAVRMLEPFYRLSRRNAAPANLTLDYSGTNPIWLPIKATLNKHYIVALVGVGAIMAEALTVCVSSFSAEGKQFVPGANNEPMDMDESLHDKNSSEETFTSFWVSFALVLVIHVSLLGILVLVYLRRSHKFLPRQVGTIASVLAFIHQSRMLVAFVGTEAFDTGRMTRHLEGLGMRYGIGWFPGRDGEDHLGIDQEPLLAEYKWGVDWTKTRVVASQIGGWETY